MGVTASDELGDNFYYSMKYDQRGALIGSYRNYI